MAHRDVALGNDNTTAVGDSSFNMTVPATVQNGDVLLAVAVMNSATVTFSISGGNTAGWTTRDGPTTINSNQRAYLWSATASGTSASSTVTVTATGGSGRFIGIMACRSAVTETGLAWALTQDSTSDTSLAWPNTTVATTGSDLVGIGTMRVASATAATMTPPTGTTQRGYCNTNTANPNYSITYIDSDSTVASGTRTLGNGTASAAVTNLLYSVALAPAAAGGLDRLKVGDSTVDAIRVGDSTVSKVYVGDTQVWP